MSSALYKELRASASLSKKNRSCFVIAEKPMRMKRAAVPRCSLLVVVTLATSLLVLPMASAFRDAPASYIRAPPSRTSRSRKSRAFQQKSLTEDDVEREETVSSLKRFIPEKWRRKGRVGDIVESVRTTTTTTRGGALAESVFSPSGPVDLAARMLASMVGVVVIFQSLHTILFSNDHAVFDELATKLLSTESAQAVKTVRTIIAQFGDHGVIDVFKEYPYRDVAMSILALSRLQRACAYYNERHHLHSAQEVKDADLLRDLAHYSVFAKAAYGWKMDLALKGRFHFGGENKVLLKQTGVREEDVVAANWIARTHRPAYFLVRDVKHRKLVLCIRGTWSARDVLTDLCCTGEDFETPSGTKRAHHGMLEAARQVASLIEETVEEELSENPDYSLVVIGHSLGGGVAAVLGTMWQDRFPGLSAYAFGCPCVAPLSKAERSESPVVSVVGEGDPFSSLSLGHIADLSSAIAHLCENESLRAAILIRSDGPVQELDEQDLTWCHEAMEEVRQYMTGETMYPPGRILYISKTNLDADVDDVMALREVPPSHFRDLRLHARMLDVSRHVPTLYESYLQRLWTETSNVM